jgi:hypothetical protein
MRRRSHACSRLPWKTWKVLKQLSLDGTDERRQPVAACLPSFRTTVEGIPPITSFQHEFFQQG